MLQNIKFFTSIYSYKGNVIKITMCWNNVFVFKSINTKLSVEINLGSKTPSSNRRGKAGNSNNTNQVKSMGYPCKKVTFIIQ